VPQLLKDGRVTRPGLGIEIAADRVNERLGIEGLLVTDVTRGGPAQRAGVQPLRITNNGEVELGDIIVGIDKVEITTNNDLYSALDDRKVGDEVLLKVRRGRRVVEVPVTLEASASGG
jgi:S1-C subfamily serine protease